MQPTVCRSAARARADLILEARERVGGTWDLFRYPGVRSDSDMFTLGFPFRPWRSDQAIVGGPAIRHYVEDTAREFGIFDRIQFEVPSRAQAGRRPTAAGRSSSKQESFTCSFLWLASGYYAYAQGIGPDGRERPRFRPYHPSTILARRPVFLRQERRCDRQRSDSGHPRSGARGEGGARDHGAAHAKLHRLAALARPDRGLVAAQASVRPRGCAGPLEEPASDIYFYDRARRNPGRVSRRIREEIGKALPPGYPVERDFNPPYKPWDQRLCLVPDGDLFAAICSGKVSIATGTIDRFTSEGLELSTGEEVKADVIVTATGLDMALGGGIDLSLDGTPVRMPERFIYKGMMLSGVPNLFLSFGYANASWTLRSDLTSRSVCRLLNRMQRRGSTTCVPRGTA